MCDRYERENRGRRFLSLESAGHDVIYRGGRHASAGLRPTRGAATCPRSTSSTARPSASGRRSTTSLRATRLGPGAQAHDGGQVALTLSRCHSSLSLWFVIHFRRSLLRTRHCQPTLKAGNPLIRTTACGCICSNLATSSKVRVSSSMCGESILAVIRSGT